MTRWLRGIGVVFLSIASVMLAYGLLMGEGLAYMTASFWLLLIGLIPFGLSFVVPKKADRDRQP